jgi:uncharacterized protein related to proFAR isomerase
LSLQRLFLTERWKSKHLALLVLCLLRVIWHGGTDGLQGYTEERRHRLLSLTRALVLWTGGVDAREHLEHSHVMCHNELVAKYDV